jgi:hypothetical protein
VLSALQFPALSINLYVTFVTNSLLASVSSHVNENVTFLRPASKRLAETVPLIAPVQFASLTVGNAVPDASKKSVPPVGGDETMSTDVPSTPSSASVPANVTAVFVPATASMRVVSGTVGVAARAATMERNAPNTIHATAAPRPRPRPRRTVIADVESRYASRSPSTRPSRRARALFARAPTIASTSVSASPSRV